MRFDSLLRRLLLSAVLAIPTTITVLAAENTPIRLSRGVAQLYVDDELIASQNQLRRTLHQPIKDHEGSRPLIAANPGTTLLAYGSIVFDSQLRRYVMFMQEFPHEGPRRMLRTTSTDGLNWDCATHGELREVKFDLDLDLSPEARRRFGIDLFSCCYDRSDVEFPYKGWLWLANCGNECEGIFYFRSHDGLTWQRGPQVVNGFAGEGDPSCRRFDLPDRTLYGPGDVTLFSYDANEKRFLGIFKFYDPRAGIVNGSRSRAYMFLDRLDRPMHTSQISRIALLPALADKNGDMRFDEFYASTAWRYESLWLGGLKIYHSQGDYPYSAAGCAFLKLVVSRDGLSWAKVPFKNDNGTPEVFIPNGPQGKGNNDGGYISEFSQGPLRVGDELIYYYCCSTYGKNAPKDVRLQGGGLFRARFRLDGFVSVDEGTLTTRPLLLAGDMLTVNSVGPVRADLLDSQEQPLASTTLSGDSLRHEVRFDALSAEHKKNEAVRLRFSVTPPGRLYSFTSR